MAVTCILSSPALANRFGARGGWNGSVASGGSNCMTCHGTRAGSGSVTVSGAPTTYSFNQIYNLTVRVADPDQLGAGFQISVEDAVGNHVGTLMIGDDGFTQRAPFDPSWVTHTFAGVDNAVAGWAAMGNAAEYHLQWKAPEADVGEIMFYLAGNAINNDRLAIDDAHVEFGEQDTIYLDAQSATAGDTCGDGKQNNGEAGIDCGGPCPDCECLVDADCDDGNVCTADVCQTVLSPAVAGIGLQDGSKTDPGLIEAAGRSLVIGLGQNRAHSIRLCFNDSSPALLLGIFDPFQNVIQTSPGLSVLWIARQDSLVGALGLIQAIRIG